MALLEATPQNPATLAMSSRGALVRLKISEVAARLASPEVALRLADHGSTGVRA